VIDVFIDFDVGCWCLDVVELVEVLCGFVSRGILLFGLLLWVICVVDFVWCVCLIVELVS